MFKTIEAFVFIGILIVIGYFIWRAFKEVLSNTKKDVITADEIDNRIKSLKLTIEKMELDAAAGVHISEAVLEANKAKLEAATALKEKYSNL